MFPYCFYYSVLGDSLNLTLLAVNYAQTGVSAHAHKMTENCSVYESQANRMPQFTISDIQLNTFLLKKNKTQKKKTKRKSLL
jgi:hypothetical protein